MDKIDEKRMDKTDEKRMNETDEKKMEMKWYIRGAVCRKL